MAQNIINLLKDIYNKNKPANDAIVVEPIKED